MTGLKARIEGKTRRRARLPLLVGDLAAAQQEAAEFRAALEVLLRTPEPKGKSAAARKAREDREKRIEAQRENLEAALGRADDCVVMIQLESLPAHEWEAIFSTLEVDDKGELDIAPIHGVLLAASVVLNGDTDPEDTEALRDPDWWTKELARPHWTQGDRAVISQTLLDLNVYAPVDPGKG